MIEFTRSVRLASKAFAARGRRLYAVGGAVRDALLGLRPADTDFSGSLSPQDAVRAFETSGGRAVVKDQALGTLDIRWPDGTSAEYTPFRRESYGRGHRPSDVALTDSLEEDAFRRDFSVNAFYRDVETGDLLDPTNGLPDLAKRVLRTTTEDPDVILRDDGLRLMRLCRLCAELGFQPEERTLDAARNNAALLADIPAERRGRELARLLTADKLHACGDVARGLSLLGVTGLYPYLTGDPPDEKQVSAALAAKTLEGRLAAIAWPAPLARLPERNLRLSGAVLRRAQLIADLAERYARADERDFLLSRIDADDEAMGEALALSVHLASLPEAAARAFAALIRERGASPRGLRDLALRGNDLAALGVPASNKTGEILSALLEHAALYPKDNTRGALLALAKNMLEE